MHDPTLSATAASSQNGLTDSLSQQIQLPPTGERPTDDKDSLIGDHRPRNQQQREQDAINARAIADAAIRNAMQQPPLSPPSRGIAGSAAMSTGPQHTPPRAGGAATTQFDLASHAAMMLSNPFAFNGRGENSSRCIDRSPIHDIVPYTKRRGTAAARALGTAFATSSPSQEPPRKRSSDGNSRQSTPKRTRDDLDIARALQMESDSGSSARYGGAGAGAGAAAAAPLLISTPPRVIPNALRRHGAPSQVDDDAWSSVSDASMQGLLYTQLATAGGGGAAAAAAGVNVTPPRQTMRYIDHSLYAPGAPSRNHLGQASPLRMFGVPDVLLDSPRARQQVEQIKASFIARLKEQRNAIASGQEHAILVDIPAGYECPICQQPVQNGEVVRRVCNAESESNGHWVCSNCAEHSAFPENACPLCRGVTEGAIFEARVARIAGGAAAAGNPHVHTHSN